MAKRKRAGLTKKVVDALEYEGTEGETAAGKKTATKHIVWDKDNAALGIRVFPSGRKVWVYEYWVDGRRRLLQLGDWPVTSRDKAKEAVDTHAGAAADAKGKGADAYDPIEARRQKTKAPTVATFCKTFMEEHASKKKTSATYQARIDRHILPAWKNRKLASIKRSDVSALHRAIGKHTPYEANRTLAQVAVMFTKAEEWGDVPEGHLNPARSVQPFKEHKRSRWVRPAELPRLAAAIDKEPSIYVRAALWLYLLTGVRKSELLQARWEHVNLDEKTLFLPDTKADREHTVPLSDAAVAVLKSIPQEGKNPHVIPGRKKDSHLVNIRKPWVRVRTEAGLEDVRLHDLRRSVGSWLVSFGAANLPLVASVLGHTNLNTTQGYAKLAEDPAQQAMEEHGKRIMEAAKGLRAVS